MKKLILLLFLPFISIGQDMTYEDLISFENKQQVERFLIERNYERYDYDDKEFINYAYNLNIKNGENWYSKSATISLESELDFYVIPITFYVGFDFFEEKDYNRIYDVAKKELEFSMVLEGIALYTGENVIVGFQKKRKSYNIILIQAKEEDLLKFGELIIEYEKIVRPKG